MNVSLDIKIGQMIMSGFRGLRPEDDPATLEEIRNGNLGSIVLFERDMINNTDTLNVESPSQVKELTRRLQQNAKIPLLISIDQEGGKINRLKEERGFPPSVSAKLLGEKDDPALTKHYADLTATTLKKIGINLNLAPNVDLECNPDNPIIAKHERSYSSDPEIVTRHAMEMIRAHHAHGVLCTLKHFPGHGSAKHDSHLRLADVSALWSEDELLPYREIIAAGLCDVVMTAHIFNSHLDAEFPATLSANIISGILRQQLGYDGVVMSDDLQMKAISSNFPLETTLSQAILAGIDIIAFANNFLYDGAIVSKAVEVIKRLVREKKITEERIDHSYRRIMRLKERINGLREEENTEAPTQE
ncbi:MAG: glycoside hydrolase family 3 protein [Bacteroidota bacterium]|nr:glycoside hydrolase family 3 protein [Bacteroidota bacterium]